MEPFYEYSFAIWPAENWGHNKAVFEVFRMYNAGGRVTMNLTQTKFEELRSGLSHSGFTVREIERVPYREPETVQ